MDEIQKAKRGIILNSIGFCVGLCTLVIDVIPVIAIGAIIFCPIYAIKDLRKYRKLQRLQLERSRPLESTSTTEFFGL
ncbi:MAG TPA: hypothetical protein VFG24_03260 [Nitrosopumilaceae archaeon]|nr:hypothetical protein [Nitrosopumilaceae archaeon]